MMSHIVVENRTRYETNSFDTSPFPPTWFGWWCVSSASLIWTEWLQAMTVNCLLLCFAYTSCLACSVDVLAIELSHHQPQQTYFVSHCRTRVRFGRLVVRNNSADKTMWSWCGYIPFEISSHFDVLKTLLVYHESCVNEPFIMQSHPTRTTIELCYKYAKTQCLEVYNIRLAAASYKMCVESVRQYDALNFTTVPHGGGSPLWRPARLDSILREWEITVLASRVLTSQ